MGHGSADASARLAADHHQETGALQHMVDRLTAAVARPWFVTLLPASLFTWIGVEIFGARLGIGTLGAAPFNGLQTLLAVIGVCISALILSSQRRQDQLAGHRDQLSLELLILSDQKMSKMIALLEESRRDNPMLANRTDGVARAMSTPADTQSVLDAIKNPGAADLD